MQVQKGIKWTFFTTGHSLGGFLATVTAIEIGQEIEKCAPCNPPRCLGRLALVPLKSFARYQSCPDLLLGLIGNVAAPFPS